jgi:RNA polymerase sigma-70 factor (ECF subfamily)
VRKPDASRPPLVEVPPPPDLDALFARFAPYVASIGKRLLGRDGEVDDLVQEVFLAALSGLRGLRDPDAARSWLATVAVRNAHRRLRRRRVLQWLGLADEVSPDDLADDTVAPEQRAKLARVYALLDRLPPDQRVAWILRHVEGERLDAVARLCGCSLATAKRRITAAHEFIERSLEP